MTYIYHYHAIKQIENIIHNQDGIIEWRKPITDWSDYLEMKAALMNHAPELGPDPKTIIVTNLSFLHTRGE